MKSVPAGEARGYGMGWNVWRHPDGFAVYYHGGNMPGVSSDLTVIPERGIVVAVLANKSCSLPYQINDEIIYRGLLAEPAAQTGAKPAAAPAASDAGVAAGTAGSWTGWVDTYAGKHPLRLEVLENCTARVTFHGAVSDLQQLRFGADSVQGVFTGDLGIGDALPDSRLRLYAERQHGALVGTIFASEPAGHRVKYGLSQWVQLAAE